MMDFFLNVFNFFTKLIRVVYNHGFSLLMICFVCGKIKKETDCICMSEYGEN